MFFFETLGTIKGFGVKPNLLTEGVKTGSSFNIEFLAFPRITEERKGTMHRALTFENIITQQK